MVGLSTGLIVNSNAMTQNKIEHTLRQNIDISLFHFAIVLLKYTQTSSKHQNKSFISWLLFSILVIIPFSVDTFIGGSDKTERWELV
jgi:hypothetical protein